MAQKQILIIGGSMAGMAAGLLLSRDGHSVTILEREVLPACNSPVEAFERWERRGAPQSRHSHAFLARLHNRIREGVPDLYAALLAAGAEQMRFHDMVRPFFADPAFLPEDDEIVLLACRRITFDWALRSFLERQGRVEFRDGVEVTGFSAVRDPSASIPRVTGVKTADGTFPADLVIDASGRRTRLGHWLREAGCRELRQESEPCGIFYCSRFYRLRDGVEPPALDGPIGADLGYMKYAIFQGDSRIFSVTLAASPEDDPMRAVLHAEAFHAAAAALPATQSWLADDVSESITPVYAFADLKNTRRFFVDDGVPLALGAVAIGDALLHSNPLSGRGCTLAWLGAELVADALRLHPDDARAFVHAFDVGVVRELVPWYEDMRQQDRDSILAGRAERNGEDPCAFERPDGTIDPKAYLRSVLRDGLLPAMRLDLVVLRAFMRVFNLLESPRNLMADPDLLARIMAVWQRRGERERLRLGPNREEMLEQLREVA